MTFLIDMNLSPQWVPILEEQGWTAIHWSSIGQNDADDSVLMSWAREHAAIIFTHDLDFGTLLALTFAESPSVVQIRSQDVAPARFGEVVVIAIRQFEAQLKAGALLVVDPQRARVRLLPLRP